MAKRGKKYEEASKLINKDELYSISDAVELVQKTATANFDETIELTVRLGVDARHADQQVRGAVVLPHGTGKVNRVLDFDVIVATPDMMGVVGRLGRVLGPKGLMPNPKSGTVTFDVEKAVNDIKAGKVEYRVDKSSIIHVPFGKKTFGTDKLSENFSALMDAIVKAKPSASKGKYLKSVVMSSTMGPGIKVNAQKLMD